MMGRVGVRFATALAGAVAALTVVGCGSESVSGQAGAEGVAAGEPVFSPCDDIPEDTLRQIGVDPATEERDIDGINQPGWNICAWRGAGYTLAVFATTRTFEEVRAKEGVVEVQPVSVAGRDGLSFREVADKQRERCSMVFSSDGGAVVLNVGYFGITKPATEQQACEVVGQAAPSLLSYVPR